MFSLNALFSNKLKSGLNLVNLVSKVQFSKLSQPLFMNITPVLYSEPVRRKKKVDPAIEKIREDRKRRKLAKDVRKLLRHSKQLKPIDEIEVPYVLIDEKEKRRRNSSALTVDVLEERVVLSKDWTAYKTKQHLTDFRMIDRILSAHIKALKELKNESEDLYQRAIAVDESLLPFKSAGPVYTPHIKDYDSPDGEYKDVSRKWEITREMEELIKNSKNSKMPLKKILIDSSVSSHGNR